MPNLFIKMLPSLIAIGVYLIISTIISITFKKIYLIFSLISFIAGLITVIVLLILNYDITMGFAIITALSLIDFIKEKKSNFDKMT